MMELDVEALRERRPEAIAELWKACRDAAIKASHRSGAREFAEDIAQEMVMVILTAFLPNYEPGREIGPYLFEMARRMGLRLYRKHSSEVLFTTLASASPDGMVDFESLVPSGEDEDSESNLLRAEQLQSAMSAKAKLFARMKEVQATSPEPTKPKVATTAERRARKRKVKEEPFFPVIDLARAEKRAHLASRPEVEELRELRVRLGYTQPQLSRLLGKPENYVRTLEGGLIVGRPHELLAAARSLAPAVESTGQESAPMYELLSGWCSRLGLDPDDHMQLGKMLSIHRTTLYRWRNEKTRPDPVAIAKIRVLVEELAQHG